MIRTFPSAFIEETRTQRGLLSNNRSEEQQSEHSTIDPFRLRLFFRHRCRCGHKWQRPPAFCSA